MIRCSKIGIDPLERNKLLVVTHARNEWSVTGLISKGQLNLPVWNSGTMCIAAAGNSVCPLFTSGAAAEVLRRRGNRLRSVG